VCRCIRFTVLLVSLLVWGSALAHESDRLETQIEEGWKERRVTAVRLGDSGIVVDGKLDDPAWTSASVSSDFRQRDPIDGDPPTERTEVRVVYDDDAVYFAVDCLDSEPDKIWAPLERRDFWVDGDRVIINVDARHDHKTGFVFGMGPSGWKWDAVTHKDGRTDSSWDGVWIGKAQIHDGGWSCEFKIPYHVLRFSPSPEHV
jgi:hypothetical protein